MSRPYTPRRAFVDIAGAATTAIVAAQTTPLPRKIRVLGLIISGGAAATTLVLKSNTTAISHTINIGAGALLSLDVSDYAWFETNAGEALQGTAGAGAGVGVTVVYDDQG